MNVLNPYVLQFLVGWINALDSVLDIGLFNMLRDSSHEIRQQAATALSEFLQEIKNPPISSPGRLISARDARSLTFVVKDLEENLGPLKVKTNAKPHEEDKDLIDKNEKTDKAFKQISIYLFLFYATMLSVGATIEVLRTRVTSDGESCTIMPHLIHSISTSGYSFG